MGKQWTIDVCRPADDVNSEREEYESKGYLVVGQIGGGELGSCLVMEDATGDDAEDVKLRHEEHMAFVRSFFQDFWDKEYKKGFNEAIDKVCSEDMSDLAYAYEREHEYEEDLSDEE